MELMLKSNEKDKAKKFFPKFQSNFLMQVAKSESIKELHLERSQNFKKLKN